MPRSVLIVKLAAIGDVIMTMPMVTAIKTQDPDARITWMCGRTVAPLVRCVDGVAEVVVVDEAAMLAGSPAAKVRAVIGAWRKNFGRRFDAVYIAHTDMRYRVLRFPIFARQTRWLGGSKGNRGIVAGRTYTDEYVRLVTGVDTCHARSFAMPNIRLALSSDLARRIDRFNSDGSPLVALTAGGARNVARDNPLRRWPLERFAELADQLRENGYRVVLVGGRTDGWVRARFFERPVLDLIGATDLPSLAAVLQRCAVVVAHDSGPLHVARMVGTPVVALLGPTPPSMFFRRESQTMVLWPGGSLPCAPCYDGNEFAKCDNNRCMQLIEVQSVMERVAALKTLSAS